MAHERHASQSRGGASRDSQRYASEAPQHVLTRMPNVGSPEPDYDDDMAFQPQKNRSGRSPLAVPILIGSGVLLLAIAVLPFLFKQVGNAESTSTDISEAPRWEATAGEPLPWGPAAMSANGQPQPSTPTWPTTADGSVAAQAPSPTAAPAWDNQSPQSYPNAQPQWAAANQSSQGTAWPSNEMSPPSQSPTWPGDSTQAQAAIVNAGPASAWSTTQPPSGYTGAQQPTASWPQESQLGGQQPNEPLAQMPTPAWEKHPYHTTGQAFPVNATGTETTPWQTAAQPSAIGTNPLPAAPTDPTQVVGRAMLNNTPAYENSYQAERAEPASYQAFGQAQAATNPTMSFGASPAAAPPAASTYGAAQGYAGSGYGADGRPASVGYGAAQPASPYGASVDPMANMPSYGAGAAAFGVGATADRRATVSPGFGSTPAYGTQPGAASAYPTTTSPPAAYPNATPNPAYPYSTSSYNTGAATMPAQPGVAQFQGGIESPSLPPSGTSGTALYR
ncbi:MAG: hypothetical protein KJZ87_05235 [Thermoguttaceae bacterium]|nr:hypothetical protein [Thermoguttaceae bacterium]